MSNNSGIHFYINNDFQDFQLVGEFSYYDYVYIAFQKVMNIYNINSPKCLPLTKEDILAIEDVLNDYKEYQLLEIKRLEDQKEIILKMNNSIEEKIEVLDHINNSIKDLNNDIVEIQSALKFYESLTLPNINKIYVGIDY